MIAVIKFILSALRGLIALTLFVAGVYLAGSSVVALQAGPALVDVIWYAGWVAIGAAAMAASLAIGLGGRRGQRSTGGSYQPQTRQVDRDRVNISWQPPDEPYTSYVSGHFATDEEREAANREYNGRQFVNDMTGSAPVSGAMEDRDDWLPTGPKTVPLRDDPFWAGNKGLKPLTGDDLRRMGLK